MLNSSVSLDLIVKTKKQIRFLPYFFILTSSKTVLFDNLSVFPGTVLFHITYRTFGSTGPERKKSLRQNISETNENNS